jgi:hypothetical protein
MEGSVLLVDLLHCAQVQAVLVDILDPLLGEGIDWVHVLNGAGSHSDHIE